MTRKRSPISSRVVCIQPVHCRLTSEVTAPPARAKPRRPASALTAGLGLTLRPGGADCTETRLRKRPAPPIAKRCKRKITFLTYGRNALLRKPACAASAPGSTASDETQTQLRGTDETTCHFSAYAARICASEVMSRCCSRRSSKVLPPTNIRSFGSKSCIPRVMAPKKLPNPSDSAASITRPAKSNNSEGSPGSLALTLDQTLS